MSRPPERRFEVKFVASPRERDRLEHWLLLQSAGLARAHPNRRVNNVYFDTPDYRAFVDNLAGISERAKLRYRWYGESKTPAAGQLELKRKRNRLGWKRVHAIARPPWSESASWADIRVAIRETLAEDMRAWLDANPLPVLLNRYERSYYATMDGALRATIDVDQEAWDQRSSEAPSSRRCAALENTMVVEFKFGLEARARATELLDGIPIRISRNSKYVNGVRAISFR